MAQAKRSRTPRKKRPAATRFYVVNTVRQTRNQVADKLEDYSQTLIARPIKRGKAAVTDLKTAPRETLSAWLDDGRATVADLNKETRSTVSTMIKDGKRFFTNASNDPRETLNDLLDDGKTWVADLRTDTRDRMDALKADTRSVITGIGKDARLVVDEVVANGRQALDKVPGKRTIAKEVRSRMRTLPAQLHLPSRRDIDGLNRRINRLTKKVDALHRAVAA